MKVRNGFVSNSSSSSFVCDVCGESYSGWDASPRDFDMYECENGHIMHEEELVLPVPDEDDPDYDAFHDYGEIPEKYCPICTFKVYREADMRKYLEKKYGDDSEEAFAEVKELNRRRKKLYDNEYVMFACKKHGTNVNVEFDEIIEKFGVYSKFYNFLRG